MDARKERNRVIMLRRLTEELTTKSWQSIDVKTLMTGTNLNRSTFYNQYHDKYDILDDWFYEILQPVINAGDKFFEAPFSMLRDTLSQADILQVFDYQRFDLEFNDRLTRYGIGRLLSLPAENDDIQLRRYIRFGRVNALIRWATRPGSSLNLLHDAEFIEAIYLSDIH